MNLEKIVDTAMEREPAELVIKNANIIDVFSQSLFKGDISVTDGVIAAIGKELKGKIEIDCAGKYVTPGLIDSHVHIESSLCSPDIFAKAVVERGTTAIIADPHEIANVCGLTGIEYMLDAAEKLPLSIYIMLPSCVPATCFENAGAVLQAKELAKFIKNKRVCGLGEMMNYQGVINNDNEVIEKLKLCIENKKLIDGHAPMLTGKDLVAYVAAGIKTDHESSTLKEMEEKIRLGMYILIREGSAVRNLKTLIKGVTNGNFSRCLFCTDDKHPDDIIKNGHIDNNVRKAIEFGIDPIMAVTIASLNAAQCYGLKNKGAIAPGYDADFLIVNNLSEFKVQQVFIKGVKAAENGESIIDFFAPNYKSVTSAVKVKPFDISALALKLKSPKVKVIKILPHDVITKAVEREVYINKENCFVYNPEKDILKLAVLERHHARGNIGLGLVENYGLKEGAVATTIAHDSHNIVVVGTNDEDIYAAVCDIIKIGGGITICKNKKILENLPLPIAGLMTGKGFEFVADKINKMRQIAFDSLNVNNNIDPFMTLSFLTLPVIPEIKLTDKGLFDVRSFAFTDISAD
ncbi:MAG: adenine deaminase [Deltaproteobacteria bacterium]|nr:adenine deaminase [Deltaproteobacteria bacterium]